MERNSTPVAWLGIELRHLAALQAVAEEQSFVRAADRLGYTQSAISNQIAALEKLVATRLVERARGGGSIALTEAGRLLYEHAQALMARLHAARNDLSAIHSEAGRPLRIGYSPSIGVGALPRIIQSFADDFPCCALALESAGDQRALLKAVAEGALDLALVSESPDNAGLASSHVFDESYVLLSDIEREPSSREDAILRPLLAPVPDAAQRWHEADLLESPRSTYGRVLRLDDAATVQALVRVGWADGLLPQLAVTDADLSSEVLDGPKRRTHVVWQRERVLSDAMNGFLQASESEFDLLRTRYEYAR